MRPGNYLIDITEITAHYRMIISEYHKRAMHLTQVATTSCGHDFRLSLDRR